MTKRGSAWLLARALEGKKLGSVRGTAVTGPTRVRSLIGVLAILVLSLVFVAGCNLGSDQGQALEEQKQKNEELQKQLEEQKEKEARRKEKEEEARQEELEKQVKDLQEKVEEQEKDQGSDSSGDSSSDTSDEGIENSDTSPSQATEGIVVVSSDFNTAAATAEEAEVINAAIEYYQYAEIGDYDTTYNLLSYEDQSYYTRDEWVASNTALDSAAGEFVVTDAYPDDLGLGVPTYAVTVTIYASDGSSFNRTTYFVNEGGYWAHYLNDEEISMFDDALY